MFPLPPKSQVGYLDPSISGEGQSANDVNWSPPPERLVMPDWSQNKKIRHYFGKKGFEAFPAILYHKDTTDEKVVQNAKEASELGIGYRETSKEEQMRFGKKFVWDWDEGCPWRPMPGPQHAKFNPAKPGTGKTYVPADVRYQQGPSVESTVAAVMAALKTVAPAAPSNMKADEWEEFQQFLAFKKASEKSGDILAKPDHASDGGEMHENALSSDQERNLWIEEAESRGIKVDKRWSTSRLKQEVEKAA